MKRINDVSAPEPSTTDTNSINQMTVTSFLIKPLTNKKSKEIDKQLVTMITKEYHPFSLVEDPEFKKLVHLLCPSYKLPTRKTLTTSLISAQYNIVREAVKQRLECFCRMHNCRWLDESK